MSNPWKEMTPMLKLHGYTEEQINEMTMAELFEILAQDEQKSTTIVPRCTQNSRKLKRNSKIIKK